MKDRASFLVRHERKISASLESAGLSCSECLIVLAAVSCRVIASFPDGQRLSVSKWFIERLDAGIFALKEPSANG